MVAVEFRVDFQCRMGIGSQRAAERGRVAGQGFGIVPQEKGRLAFQHAIFKETSHAHGTSSRESGAEAIGTFANSQRLEFSRSCLQSQLSAGHLVDETRIARLGLFAEIDFNRAARLGRLADPG